MARKANEAGIELVKRYESFRSKAYLCPANKLTIGYGHVILAGESYLKTKDISEQEAIDILIFDMKIAENAVERYVKVELNDNQFSALCSFTFNLGSGNLKASTLLKRLNQGDYDCVPSQLDRWVYANKKRLNGLVKRRKSEGELFVTPDTVKKCCCPCHDK